ncbi:Flp pilus assembly protein CpaB [Roseibium sp.]|uniref:Flp pilus assembly protein CpaB n=1 Tax=Roseibium sp. TaxID=1936156 RepID=UPI003BB1875E
MSVLRWGAVIFLAVLTSLSAWFWTSQYKADLTSARFLKLKNNVALIAGETVLEDDMIEVAELPKKFASDLSAFAIPVTYRKSIVGLRAIDDVQPGSLLFYQSFSPENGTDLTDQLAPGKRALTLAVNVESTVGYFVRPGSRVDLLGTFVVPSEDPRDVLDPRLAMQTRVLLENIKVLAVGSARDFPEYQRISSRGYGSVTFELTPKQANLVTFAQQQMTAPLTMVLRRDDDTALVDLNTTIVDWEVFNDKPVEQ